MTTNDTLNIAVKTLTDAALAIEARQAVYGPPNKNFEAIAEMWTVWLRTRYGKSHARLDAADVAAMSALIKLARLAETPAHADSWVDLAGYAACGTQVTKT